MARPQSDPLTRLRMEEGHSFNNTNIFRRLQNDRRVHWLSDWSWGYSLPLWREESHCDIATSLRGMVSIQYSELADNSKNGLNRPTPWPNVVISWFSMAQRRVTDVDIFQRNNQKLISSRRFRIYILHQGTQAQLRHFQWLTTIHLFISFSIFFFPVQISLLPCLSGFLKFTPRQQSHIVGTHF